MDKPSPLTASAPLSILPPAPARGAHAPQVSPEDFRAMLGTQGIKGPAGPIPSAAEARIEAAQIAAKAHVNAAVKRDPVVSGMQPPRPQIVAPNTGRFMPLRQGPTAARTFTGPTSHAAANTLDGLRATTKFAPGPIGPIAPIKPRAKTPEVPEAAPPAPPPAASAVPPSAVEAYTYGLRAASEKRQGQLPAWFDSAVQQGLDKYDALNKARKKP